MCMTRGCGGNQFVEGDANMMEVLLCIRDQLQFIEKYAEEDGRKFDLAEITVTTKRIPSGRISVNVEADLG